MASSCFSTCSCRRPGPGSRSGARSRSHRPLLQTEGVVSSEPPLALLHSWTLTFWEARRHSDDTGWCWHADQPGQDAKSKPVGDGHRRLSCGPETLRRLQKTPGCSDLTADLPPSFSRPHHSRSLNMYPASVSSSVQKCRKAATKVCTKILVLLQKRN